MAGNIKGITIEIDGNTTKLDSALSKVESNTKNVNGELRQVNNLLKFNPGNADVIAQKQELLARNVENTSQKLQVLKDAQAQVEAQFASGDLGEEEYRAFQREIVATEGKLQSYQGQLKAAETSQSDYENSTKRLETLFTATGKSVDDFSDVLGSKLVNAIKEGKANASQLDDAFEKIAQASGVAEDDVGELARSLDKFDGTPQGLKETSSDLDRLSDKAEHSGSVFTSFKEKLSFGAIASVGAQAVSTLTGGIGSLISESVDASDALDKFKSTMHFAGIGDDEIDKVTAKVKKYADDTVYDLQTVTNTTAQLASNGVKNYEGLTESAGNLNAVAGGNADTFQSVAMVLTQTAGAGKLTTENWNQLADAIPGASGPLQEAMKKNGAYTGNFRDAMADGQITADEFNQAMLELGQNDSAVKAAKSTSTFEGAIGNLQASIVNGINEIINAIGKANMTDLISKISDGIVGALKKLVSALKFVGEHKDAFKVLAVSVLAAVGAFKAFTIVSKIVEMVRGFSTAIKAGKTAMAALNLVLSANPFILLGVAIAAVAAGLVYFFSKTKKGQEIWATFTNFLKNAWNGIKEIASTVWNAIADVVTNVADNVKNAWSGIADFFSTLWQGIVDVTTTIWNGVKDFFSNLWQGIVSVATTAWDGFTEAISPITDAIKELFSTLGEFFSTLWQGISDVATTIWQGISDTATTIWGGLRDFFTTLWDGITDVFTAVWTTILSILQPIWDGIVLAAQTVWGGLKDFFTTLWDGIKLVFTTVWDTISAFLQPVWEGIVLAAQTVWGGIKDFFASLWDGIKTIFQTTWDNIKTIVDTVINVIAGIIRTITDAIKGNWDAVWNDIKGIIETVWNGIKDVVTNTINGVKDVITSVWNGIKDLTTSVWNGIKDVVTGVWDGIKSAAETAFNSIKDLITNVWNGIKSVSEDVWNGIKSLISTVWDNIKSTAQSAVDGIKSTVEGGWNNVKSVTSDIWNALVSAIETPMNTAKEKVSSVIEAIKGFFNFKITWPHIPLPHFRASGSANPLDWVKGKNIPSIGIDWYAKGGILTKPTVFSGSGNSLSIGGEAGPEGVIPLNEKTLGAIGRGIAEANGGVGTNIINLTVYGNLDTATARKWGKVLAVELQRGQKRNNLSGG